MPFPNLPYLIDGEVKLSETTSIMRYLCDQYRPEMLASTPAERGLVDMLLTILHDAKFEPLCSCYPQTDRKLPVGQLRESFKKFSEYLGEKEYFTGTLRVCDVYFIELMEFA